MLITFIRTAILYFIVIISIRLMGKRQIGELQPYELVITLMLSDLASLPMQDTRLPLLLGIVPIITLLFVKILISEIQQHSRLFEKILDGTPSIIISDGEINLEMMKKQRLTMNDILEELRSAGYLDISDIQYAIIETNGTISIIPKSACDTVKRKDLKIKESESKIPIVLFEDGHLNKKALQGMNKDEKWLDEKLKSLNYPPRDKLFLVMMDSNGKLFIQRKNQKDKEDIIL
ncbi:DUF421 domain-containing protein [Clostridium perfringens]|uniref:DUF421 domain-containing protein n=1 Tax=Clostridium perfringens TaxID=1502 RepID=UPI000D8C3A60|nr:DUF421 domain-containing protein [Clostridium perfringens]EHK2327103.1 DUF421 domain-containing protein [Clostridium perfringens]MBI5998750.1 DUF421 domain-containing protein [Clostridium perfringens]MBS5967543.1 DUF421 domain-containing protein [Clostridium perfringens]MDM0496495.1 DUF421 domain-containing protein [Clostridium perfringens]MDU2664188.1 DUF421 domain-containing protein [Clostridium perfringens]